MTPSDHKKYYSRFLSHLQGKLHFAAHSHHFWPDITREAHLAYWDDSAELSDSKWNKIFGKVIPEAQNHIASILHLKDAKQVVFAPNTHELGARILSLFLGKKNLHVLTTGSEFHSWKRQILRLDELPSVHIQSISTVNLLENRAIFINEIKQALIQKPDIFFISQVFFDSGLALTDAELLDLNSACSVETIMVVDGYHGFAALPTDLSKLEGKIFYLGGGYKYAQAGEGAAFMVVPEGNWRPAYTGWFAEYGDLARQTGTNVGYAKDGFSFFGATQDFSGLYRFNAVWDLFKNEDLNVVRIHEYILSLQREFIRGLGESFLLTHELTPLFSKDFSWHGHFLTYKASSELKAQELEETLKKLNTIIDRRGDRLRFGFGLYQNKADVENLLQRLQGPK
jgi:selenocysteine lyase/cysteine desulfurase